jgi:hypothetical protein
MGQQIGRNLAVVSVLSQCEMESAYCGRAAIWWRTRKASREHVTNIPELLGAPDLTCHFHSHDANDGCILQTDLLKPHHISVLGIPATAVHDFSFFCEIAILGLTGAKTGGGEDPPALTQTCFTAMMGKSAGLSSSSRLEPPIELALR